jgi:hypothetical protein
MLRRRARATKRGHATMRAFTMILGALLAPAAASAGLVSPGQTVGLESVDLPAPGGALVATGSVPFAIDYGPSTPATGSPAYPGTLAGTLHNAVYRGTDGRLTFVYDVDLTSTADGGTAAEGSELRVGSFKGFSTDVGGALDFENLFAASRSADGATLRLASDTPGLGGPPTLVVRTDATAYDRRGSATYSAADELSTPDGSSNLYAGQATVTGLFRPTGDGTLPPATPPNAIPLPPAAYSGLGLLLAMGMIVAARRVARLA